MSRSAPFLAAWPPPLGMTGPSEAVSVDPTLAVADDEHAGRIDYAVGFERARSSPMRRLGLAWVLVLLATWLQAPAARAATVEVWYELEVATGVPSLGAVFAPPGMGFAQRVRWQGTSAGDILPGPVQWTLYHGGDIFGGLLYGSQSALRFTLGGRSIRGSLHLFLSTVMGDLGAGGSFQIGSIHAERFGYLYCLPYAGTPTGGCSSLGLAPGGSLGLGDSFSPNANPLQPMNGMLTAAEQAITLAGAAGTVAGHVLTFSVVGTEVLRTTDRDDDGKLDAATLFDPEPDNCLDDPNGPLIPDAGGNSQLNADGDAFGNICDCDFNQDDVCAQPDYSTFLACFGDVTGPGNGSVDDPDCEESDMNGDRAVGQPDYSFFLSRFGEAPGP